ncbi:tail protein X [Anoxybacillus ayderensis]|uniref:tail protein X n=2 Tax=Anoxybacillus TaxID=150247 RepID=UPI00068A22EF|nr:tail protein X [Anoxybacillus ayderensis]MED0687594.1 tail protein X [Anoxybacillus ayderensis]
MGRTYITVQGDTWDKIAYETLGSEYSLPFLLEANKKYRHIVIFPSGLKINIPDITTSIMTKRPAWLGEDDEL